MDNISTRDYAIQAINEHEYDLILLDLHFNAHNNNGGIGEIIHEIIEEVEEKLLHHFPGVDIFKKIRSEYGPNKDTPVIVYSIHDNDCPENVREYLEGNGYTEYFGKLDTTIMFQNQVKGMLKSNKNVKDIN